MPRRPPAVIALLGALLGGCDRAVVRFGDAEPEEISTSPELLDLGVVFVGSEARSAFTVGNTGAVELGVHVSVAPAAWATVELTEVDLTLDAGDEVEVGVVLVPTLVGEGEGVLVVADAWGGELGQVPLVARVQRDDDGDGHGSLASGGEDCDDAAASVHPGAEEVWYDGVDQDCAGDADDDQDHDGVGVQSDCDDLDPTVGVPPPERWNGLDDDCDGVADDLTASEAAAGIVSGPAGARIGTPATMSWGVGISRPGSVDLVLGAPTAPDAGKVWVVEAAGVLGGDATVGDAAYATVSSHDPYPLGWMGPRQGDVDKDGADDLLVDGSTWDFSGGDGKAWVVLGGSLPRDLEVDDAAVGSYVGDSEHDAVRVAVAHDLDGDGAPEVAVGAPFDQRRDDDRSIPWTGNVAVWAAGRFQRDYNLSEADEQIQGGHENLLLGATLTPTDLDDDGYGDLLVGAPGCSERAEFAGSVYYFRGNPALEWESVSEDAAAARLAGDTRYGSLGIDGVAVPGDVDGDGRLDVAVGDPDSGRVAVWSGAGALRGSHGWMDSGAVWSLEGRRCGASLVIDSDLDADGTDELLVGCPGAGEEERDQGAVLWLDGRGDAYRGAYGSRAQLVGDSEGDGLGEAMLGGFDADGDGREDLLVGAPGNDRSGRSGGAVYLLLGP